MRLRRPSPNDRSVQVVHEDRKGAGQRKNHFKHVLRQKRQWYNNQSKLLNVNLTKAYLI